MPKKRYAMYLRKSREDVEAEKVGHFETLARHEKQLWRFAEQLGIADCIAEEDIHRELASGESLAERKECQKILRKVSDGLLTGVLTVDIDRISRGDMIDQGTIASVFRYSHTPILTPSKIYDPENDLDMQFMEMRLMFSRIEYEQIKKRMCEGRVRSVMDGQYISPYAPFGFEKCVVDRKKTLRFGAHADTNRWMYRSIAGGETAGSVARRLNEQGIRTKKGRAWDYGDVVAVIANVACKGYVSYGVKKTTTVVDADGRKRKKLVSGDPIIVKGLHEGTVPEELWAKANAMLERNAKPRTKADLKLKNPFAGILVCSKCGRPLRRVIDTRSVARTARFTHIDDPMTGCWMKSARADVVTDAVVDALSDIAADLEVSGSKPDDGLRFQMNGIAKHIKELDGAMDNLFRLAEFGRITDDEFSKRKEKLDAEAEEARKSMDEIAAIVEDQENSGERVIKLKEAVKVIRGNDAEKANKALKMIVKRIEYANDGERTSGRSSGTPMLRIVLR